MFCQRGRLGRLGILGLFGILSFVVASKVSATPLSTDLLVFVPKNIAQTITGAVTGKYQFQTANLTIPGIYPIQLENLDLNLDYQLKTLNLKDLGAFDATLDFTKVRVRATGLHVDAMTEKLINGVIVRVRVKVDCMGAVLETRNPIPAAGNGKVTNTPLLAKLDQLAWAANSQQWQFSAEKCEGDSAVADIEAQVNSFFNNSVEFKKAVLERTNSVIDEWLLKNRSWAKQFPELNSVVTTTATEILDNGKSWVLRLAVQMNPLMDCPSFTKEPLIPSPPTTPGPDGIEMQIPSRAATVIAQCLHEMGQLYRRDRSSQMVGLREFMQSWMKKFIYWGDLNRFASDQEWLFLSKTVGEFSFVPKEVSAKKTESGSIFFLGQATIESQMKFVPTEGDPLPYVTFYMDVWGTMSIDTLFTTPAAATLFTVRPRNNPGSKLGYRWNIPLERLSNTGINTTAINDELGKTLKASTLQFQLDPIAITPSHQLNVVGLRMTGGLIQFQLQIHQREAIVKPSLATTD